MQRLSILSCQNTFTFFADSPLFLLLPPLLLYLFHHANIYRFRHLILCSLFHPPWLNDDFTWIYSHKPFIPSLYVFFISFLFFHCLSLYTRLSPNLTDQSPFFGFFHAFLSFYSLPSFPSSSVWPTPCHTTTSASSPLPPIIFLLENLHRHFYRSFVLFSFVCSFVWAIWIFIWIPSITKIACPTVHFDRCIFCLFVVVHPRSGDRPLSRPLSRSVGCVRQSSNLLNANLLSFNLFTSFFLIFY